MATAFSLSSASDLLNVKFSDQVSASMDICHTGFSNSKLSFGNLFCFHLFINVIFILMAPKSLPLICYWSVTSTFPTTSYHTIIPFLQTKFIVRSSYGRNTVQGKQDIWFLKLVIPLTCWVITDESFPLTGFSSTWNKGIGQNQNNFYRSEILKCYV